jgi:hypothetical protein
MKHLHEWQNAIIDTTRTTTQNNCNDFVMFPGDDMRERTEKRNDDACLWIR